MLNPEECKKAILAIEALGSTPAVLVKVTEMVKDPNANMQAICSLLRNDGPLTADIIRLSNSVYYAPLHPHTNLMSSVNMIGQRELLRVINMSLSRQLFARDLASYGMTACDYWSASVASALLMEGLARALGQNTDDAYTLGILHAVGRLLINQVIEDFRFTVYWDGVRPIQEWEREAVGFDYAEAGALLLERWRFQKDFCDVIRWQLAPEKVEKPVSFLGILQFILRLLPVIGLAFEHEEWTMPQDDRFLTASGLDVSRLRSLVEESKRRYETVLQSLDLIWVSRASNTKS